MVLTCILVNAINNNAINNDNNALCCRQGIDNVEGD